MADVGTAYVSLAISGRGISRSISEQLASVNVTRPGRMMGNTLGTEIGAGLSRAGAGIQAAGSKITQLGTRVSALTRPARLATTALAGMAAVTGFRRLVQLDTAKTKLTALGNSAETVTGIMRNANAAVKGTAFGLDAAATVAASAVAASIKPGAELQRTLALVADAASVAGTDMQSMGAIFNKVAASGKVSGIELNQLTTAGLPILRDLAKVLGVSEEQVYKLASAGKIGFAEFQAAMELGVGGAAKKMGESFTGGLKNIGASIARIGQGFLDAGGTGGGFFSQLKPLMQALLETLVSFEDKAAAAGAVVGEFFAKIVSAAQQVWQRFSQLPSGVQKFIATLAGVGAAAVIFGGPLLIVIGKIATGIGAVVSGAGMLAPVFGALTSTVGLVVAGVIAAGAALGWFLTQTEAGRAILSTLAETFRAIGEQISAALAPVLPVLGQALSDLAAAIGPLIGQFVELFVQASPLSLLFQIITPLLPTIVDLFAQIGQVIGEVIAAVAPLIAELVSGLVPVITEIVTTVAPALVEIFQTLAPVIGEVIAAVAPLIVALASELMPVIEELTPVVKTVFESLAPIISGALRVVLGIIQAVTGVITGDWSKAWEGIQNIFGGVWDEICAIVQGAINIVSSVVSAGLNLVSGLVGSVLSGISGFFADTWNNVISGVSGFISELIGFFTSLPGRILGVLSGLGSLLIDSGKSLIRGFIDGIQSMVGAIGDAVAGVMDAARAFFPFSPAKRGPFSGTGYTTYSGAALMKDFAASITKERRTVEAAIQSGLAAPDSSTRVSSRLNMFNAPSGPHTQSGPTNNYGPIYATDVQDMIRQIEARQAQKEALYAS